MLVADVEDRKNVGMIERRGSARFLREALHAVTVGREGRRQDLDGDDSIQPAHRGRDTLRPFRPHPAATGSRKVPTSFLKKVP